MMNVTFNSSPRRIIRLKSDKPADTSVASLHHESFVGFPNFRELLHSVHVVNLFPEGYW